MSVDYDHYKNGGLLNNRYLKVEDISEGAYGIVSLAEDTHNERRLVLVKYITQFIDDDQDQNQSQDQENKSPEKENRFNVSKSEGSKPRPLVEDRSMVLKEAKQEIDILKKLGSHPNITELYDSFDSYLILEYCSRGDLYEIIKSNCGPVSTKDILDVMSQLIEAVTYAHNLGIYHRDIKPENILVTDDWTIKLTDWGLATDQKICTDFNVGSERYMAPELFDNHNIDCYEAAKCDIWSIGICLLNIVFGKNPFKVANQSDKLFVHFAANRETIFDIFPSMSYELFAILRHTLTIDPENRDLESVKLEMTKARHLTIDYDLESVVSDDNENRTLVGSQERSKSIPAITHSPEKAKFVVRGSRKPLAIPSQAQGIAGRNYKANNNNFNHSSNYNNNYNNNNNGSNATQYQSSYNRQDYFTPKSVFNHYMDKIDRYHKDNRIVDGHQRTMGGNNNRSKYYKRKNPNKRAWRKSYKKPSAAHSSWATSKVHNSDATGGSDVFLKPISFKKISPPSSQELLKTQRTKRYSAHSYSSSSGKYVPPNLRSPHLEPRGSEYDVIIGNNTEFEDDADLGDVDDDDMFMLEEYKSSPKKSVRKSRKKNNDFQFNYPQEAMKVTSLSNRSLASSALDPAPLVSSSSNGSTVTTSATATTSNKYVPPHHRRNSHSAVLSHRNRSQLQSMANKNKRNSLLLPQDFEPSSVPSSWSLKSDRLTKVNRKFNKNYNGNDVFSVNDMYHTFSKMNIDSKDMKNTSKSSEEYAFDDDDDEDGGAETDFSSLKNQTLKFTTREIPSITS